MKKSLKIVTGIAVTALALLSPLTQAYADRGTWMPIQVNLEGKLLDMPVDPVIQGGTTLVPMRSIFESLGATIKWDSKTKTVTGTKSGTTVKLVIGKKQATTNGKTTQLEVAPKIINGSTMIPLRYVSESLGMYVGWVPLERQVYIAKDREIEGTTMASVTALYNKYAPTYKGDRFAEKPSYTAPYKAGKLADGFLQDGLKAANFVREMAKLPTLVLNSEFNEYAQYGAVLLTGSNQYTHTPVQPAGVSSDFFAKAYTGTSSSNLHAQSESVQPTELAEAVRSLIMDRGVESLGHRRWILNPNLNKVGFGFGSILRPENTNNSNHKVSTELMYVLDNTKYSTPDYNYIAWPSKGYYPVSWLDAGTNFSITLNPSKYMKPDGSKVKVTVNNITNGSVVELTQGGTGFGFDLDGFIITDDSIGEGSTIYFSPVSSDVSYEAPNPGDEFVVELSGIYKTDGAPTTIKYTVKLFAM